MPQNNAPASAVVTDQSVVPLNRDRASVRDRLDHSGRSVGQHLSTLVRGCVGATVLWMGSLGPAANATPLNGSIPLVGFSVTQDGANLSQSSMISMGLVLSSSAGSGDFNGVPVGTSFGSNVVLNFNNLSVFSLTSAYGNFVANSLDNEILQKTASFADVYLRGTFTPSGSLSAYDPTDTSLRMSINQSGASISVAMTLNSPAQDVPGVPEIDPAGLGSVLAMVGGVLALREQRVRKAA